MLDMPNYILSEWYDDNTDSLSEDAPEELQNEFRFYHADAYYSDKKDRKIVAQYTDKKGKQYVIDRNGVILYQGIVDRNKYPNEWDL